jgi:hypothetical protein
LFALGARLPTAGNATSNSSCRYTTIVEGQATLVSFRYCGQFRLGGKMGSSSKIHTTPLLKKLGRLLV